MANPPISNARIGVANERSVASGVRLAPDDPAVTGPDLIVQVSGTAEWTAGTPIPPTPCLNDVWQTVIKGQLADLFKTIKDDPCSDAEPLFPDVFVDCACAGGPDPANQSAAFGVWLNPPADTAAGHMSLDTNIGRAQRETIAFYINRTLFEALAAKNFPADPSSSIHLHKPLEVDFKSPDTIVTKVHGTDTDPVPDVDFTETITERFTGGPGSAPQWYDAQLSLDADETWVDVLAVVLSGVPLLNFAAWYQAGAVAHSGPQQAQGAGSAVAAGILPLSIPFLGGKKFPIEYVPRDEHNGGTEVDASGMYVGGFIRPEVAREPFASLTGMTNVSLHVGGGGVDDPITTHTRDLRGNLTFAWTVNGKHAPSNGPCLTLSFDPSVGPFGAQNVAVTVTDEDGLTAEAGLQVTASRQQPSGPDGKTSKQNPIHPA